MINETYEILDGIYPTIESVQIKFTKIVEQSESITFSEQDIINTIAALEQRKLMVCDNINAEIAINNERLLKIRAIDRTNNITVN